MPAFAVEVAQYPDGADMLPFFNTVSGIRVSLMPAHNPLLIGLRSTIQAGTAIQRAQLILRIPTASPQPADGYTFTINGFDFVARDPFAATRSNWARPPVAPTAADWLESLESLYRLLIVHPVIGALYDINIASIAPNIVITITAKTNGEDYNFTFSQTAALALVTINNVTSTFVADQFGEWVAWLTLQYRTDDFARLNFGEIPLSGPLTSIGELARLEKGLTPNNVIPFDVAPYVRSSLQTYPPVHDRNANAALRAIFCRDMLLNVMAEFGDWHFDGYIKGGREDYLAQAASSGYNRLSWWVLNASLPANLTQQELHDQCWLRILQGVTGRFLSNCPNGSVEAQNYSLAKRIHVDQHEFLYFLYWLVTPGDRNRRLYLIHDVQFENGTTVTHEIPYQFEYNGVASNTISVANGRGGVFYAEVGVRAIEAFLGQTLETIETTANSKVRYIRVWAGTAVGMGPKARVSEYRFYELDNVNRCAPELNEVYFLNRWGGYDTLGAIGRRVANLQTSPASFESTWNITNRTRADKATDRTEGAYDFEADFRLDLNSGWMYPWAFDWLREMLTSTDIYVYAPDYHDELLTPSAPQFRTPFNPATIEQSTWASRDDDELQSLAFSITLQPEPNFIKG